MTSVPVISEVGHVAIRVTDLEAAEEFAVEVMGLSVTERSDDAIWVTHGTCHHSLHYILGDHAGIDHVGLVAPNAEALATVRERIDRAEFAIVSDGPLSRGVEDGFAFEGPEGFVIEVYSRMRRVERRANTAGVRPKRLGHANFFPRDTAPMMELFVDLLDFRVSDRLEGGTWLRCNVDHHGVGVFEGSGVLHHYAFEVPTMIELGQFADLINARGDSVIWGPTRHGIGENIATYYREPSGLVVEYYSDMEQIFDEASHVPGEWSRSCHKWYSVWGPEPLPDEFGDFGLPPYRNGVSATDS